MEIRIGAQAESQNRNLDRVSNLTRRATFKPTCSSNANRNVSHCCLWLRMAFGCFAVVSECLSTRRAFRHPKGSRSPPPSSSSARWPFRQCRQIGSGLLCHVPSTVGYEKRSQISKPLFVIDVSPCCQRTTIKKIPISSDAE